MKTIIKYILLTIFCFFTMTVSVLSQEIYFYGIPENIHHKVHLNVIPNTIAVKFSINPELGTSFMRTLLQCKRIELLHKNANMYQVHYIDNIDATVVCEQLKNRDEIDYATPIVVPANTNYDMYLTDEIIVQFKQHVTNEEIEDICNSYETTIARNTLFPNEFVLKLPNANGLRSIDVSNILHESDLTSYAVPNFRFKISFFYDPYYRFQYYLNSGANNDINAPEAWNITKGDSSIVIAILDEGIDADHEDLPKAQFVYQRDWADNDSDATPTYQSIHNAHGTAVAGIICSIHDNNIGIKGVAPNCNFMNMKIVRNDTSLFASNDSLMMAIDDAWQNGASVITNSWGFQYSGATYTVPNIVAAINRAKTLGRGNGDSNYDPGIDKGCVVVFAAGNNGQYAAFPSTVAGVVCVGALDSSSNKASYSPSDDEIFTVAYGGEVQTVYSGCLGSAVKYSDIWTTDKRDSGGYNPCWFPSEKAPQDYTSKFGATSAACPQVAGVAALVLSMNKNLTEFQVRETLRISADDLDSLGRDNNTGYGRLNAYKAVRNQYMPSVFPTVDSAITIVKPGQAVVLEPYKGTQSLSADRFLPAHTYLEIHPGATLYIRDTLIIDSTAVINLF